MTSHIPSAAAATWKPPQRGGNPCLRLCHMPPEKTRHGPAMGFPGACRKGAADERTR